MLNKKAIGSLFVSIATSFIIIIYYTYITQPHGNYYSALLSLIIFHILYLMLLWSFIHSSISEPGVVPPLWGFYMGDSEHKRKRYCLLCHVFKPDRCHHCSICNRCVLNMDHHCRIRYVAWINNCIGFYNRKLFMLMLLYSILTGYFVLLSFLPEAYQILLKMTKLQSFTFAEIKFLGIALLVLFFCIILTKFSAFHVKLILKNSTTIESLENNYNYCYSISLYRNYTQVFGSNPWMWFFPVYGRSGKPSGDGILWPMIDNHFSDSDVNVESEANRENSVKPLNNFGKNEWSGDRKSVSPLGMVAKSPSDVDTDSSFIRLNSRTPNRP
jgi:hypothetical protein